MRTWLIPSLLVLACTSASGQRKSTEQPQLSVRTEPLYKIRLESASYLGSTAIVRSCLLVRADLTFHFESSKQLVSESRPRLQRLAEGHLTKDQVEELDALLTHPDVASAPDMADPVGIIPYRSVARVMTAEIPRDRFRTQQVRGTVLPRQPVDAALKPLAGFMDSIASGSPPATKTAKPDLCALPRESAPAK